MKIGTIIYIPLVVLSLIEFLISLVVNYFYLIFGGLYILPKVFIKLLLPPFLLNEFHDAIPGLLILVPMVAGLLSLSGLTRKGGYFKAIIVLALIITWLPLIYFSYGDNAAALTQNDELSQAGTDSRTYEQAFASCEITKVTRFSFSDYLWSAYSGDVKIEESSCLDGCIRGKETIEKYLTTAREHGCDVDVVVIDAKARIQNCEVEKVEIPKDIREHYGIVMPGDGGGDVYIIYYKDGTYEYVGLFESWRQQLTDVCKVNVPPAPAV